MNDLEKLLQLKESSRKNFLDKLGFYTYALCEITSENKRIPFYIGKGKNDRCLKHIEESKITSKTKKIIELFAEKKLGIDILCYGVNEETALVAESVSIDLMNIENLTNAVRGHGENAKRLPINELLSILNNKPIKVLSKHKGVAFLLERTFKHTFGDLEILEHTRGIWSRKQDSDVKFAYATFRGIVKEVYEIYTWVPAGTQQYFTRKLNKRNIKDRHEFVGKKAEESIRDRYVGKLIEKDRSYGTPFVKVGFET